MRYVMIALAFFCIFYMAKSCKSSKKDKKARKAIEIVLQQYVQYGNINNSSRAALSNSVRNFYYNLRSIDLSACPSDFQSAFIEHVDVVGEFKDLIEDIMRFEDRNMNLGVISKAFVRGWKGDFLSAFFDCCDILKENSELSGRKERIMQKLDISYEKILRVAKKYKVKNL